MILICVYCDVNTNILQLQILSMIYIYLIIHVSINLACEDIFLLFCDMQNIFPAPKNQRIFESKLSWHFYDLFHYVCRHVKKEILNARNNAE